MSYKFNSLAIARAFTLPLIARWDKYENKQLYWIEEDLSAEWEKTTSKSRRAETEYQSSVGVSDAFESSLAPVSFSPEGVGPSTGQETLCWYKLRTITMGHNHAVPPFLDILGLLEINFARYLTASSFS